MKLPPTFLDELRSRVSLAQVAGRKVVWDMRKSQQGRGDWWAPCPFHQEKTASFHVDDRKGFYYCFGCHEKGDAIGFVMASENLSFMEAVKVLAGEAGMSLPEPDPKARQKADRAGRLHEVMDEAQRYFALQIRGGGGQAARSYLDGRGLDEAARDRWEIGLAPEGWRGLTQHLAGKGVPEEMLLAAGLAKRSDKGGGAYDVFRHRIMFPIRDGRGRLIAFGGRAMDPGDNAKYLNSPQTEIFDKSRALYNQAGARAAARDAPLIVAEGYMDVIALGEAGFGAAVAPMGTAITEAQLTEMWRMHPEPILALDGDAAGQRSLGKAIDTALPLLGQGRTLRFCVLPPGQDPDDVIRAGGASAMRACLDGAAPLIEMLWQRETAGRSFDTPERRAALDGALDQATGRIADPGLRRHYEDALRERKRALFRPERRPWVPRGKAAAPVGPHPGTRGSPLVADPGTAERMREAVVLAVLIRHPALLPRVDDALSRIDFSDPMHARLARALLAETGHDGAGGAADTADGRASGTVLRDRLDRAVGGEALETLLSARHLTVVPALRSDDAEAAMLCLRGEMAKLTARRGAERELQEALEDIALAADEALTWRLTQAARARDRAQRGEAEDDAEYDIAPNGVRMDRDERKSFAGMIDRLLAGGQNDGS